MKNRLIRHIHLLPWIVLAALLFCEPLMANKFETIGGGVQGSTQVKAEYLQVVAYVAGGIFLISGILSIVLHDKNAHALNYTMWKSSAALFFLLSIGAFAAAVFIA
jgi:hypothetical protein